MSKPIDLAQAREAPDPTIVACLEQVLADAKAGRVQAIALAHLGGGPNDNAMSWHVGHRPGSNRLIRLHATISILAADLLDQLRDGCERLPGTEPEGDT